MRVGSMVNNKDSEVKIFFSTFEPNLFPIKCVFIKALKKRKLSKQERKAYMYQNQKDETLVMLTLTGEQNAYSALVARYENAVIAAAASITHNRHMAEDSAQDAFIAAWIKLNMLREPCKYGAWG